MQVILFNQRKPMMVVGLLAIIFILVMSVSAQTITFGEPDVPPVPQGLTIQVGEVPSNPPANFAPAPDACDNAAGSYLSEGMEAKRTTLVSFDDIVYDNQDEELVYYALYFVEAAQFGFFADNRFEPPTNSMFMSLSMNGNMITDGDLVTVGAGSACVLGDGVTLRLVELENGEWVIDTIAYDEPLDISSSWEEQAPQQLNQNQIAQPQNPVLIDGLVFRYLLPYITPPITTAPTANEIAPSDDQLTVCPGAAPSYLSVGEEVALSGYGYEKMPTVDSSPQWDEWEFSNTEFQLGEYGMNSFIEILNETPLTSIPGNFDSVIQSVQELYGGTLIPQGTIIDGPICAETDAMPEIESEPCGWDTWPIMTPCTGGEGNPEGLAPNQFYTLWQVELLNGETGWYPENVGRYAHWLWDTNGIFPRKLFLYYMTPTETMTAMAMVEEEDCQPTLFYPGAKIQPYGVLNRRIEPNGDVIGVLEAGQSTIIFGEPECNGGTNWWQTDIGGWIAETDPETDRTLFQIAVDPTATPIPPTAQPTDVPQVQPTDPPPRPTEVSPTTAPTTVPTTAPTDRPTEVPPTQEPTEPVRPTEEPTPTCDPPPGGSC